MHVVLLVKLFTKVTYSILGAKVEYMLSCNSLHSLKIYYNKEIYMNNELINCSIINQSVYQSIINLILFFV